MSINLLFQKANKSFLSSNYVEGLKIYLDILFKYPNNVRLVDEVKRTLKKHKKIIPQSLTNKEISTLFDMHSIGQTQDAIKKLKDFHKKDENDVLIISLLGNFYALSEENENEKKKKKKAIEKAPFEVSFYQNFSTTLKKLDRNIEALSTIYFSKILSLNDKLIDFELAKLNTLLRKFSSSDFFYQNLIKDKNLDEDILYNYCMNLIEWKKEEKVITFLDKHNDSNEVKNLLLGLANFNLNEFNISKDCFIEVTNINPSHFLAYTHLGNCYQELGFLEKAIDCHRASLKIKPNNKTALNHLGALWYFNGDINKAEEIFFDAIKEIPNNFDGHYYLGLCQLAKSNYKEGWLNYAFRWLYKNFDSIEFNSKLPKFKLEATSGNIIIWDEQGIGDSILFLRFLKDVKPLVKKIFLSIDKRLHPIIKRLNPEILFYNKEDKNSDIEKLNYQIPLGDLGSLFIKSNDYFLQNNNSYIIVNKKKTDLFKIKLKDKNKLKCGVSWVSINKKIGSKKSLTLNNLKPILSIPDITFIDLQYNDTIKERQEFENQSGIKINKIDDLDNFNDIDGVISLIDTCDFVITISNSNAHFSGALGKETFLLLPKGKGKLWYWSSLNGKSIWYPSIKIIEQEKANSWDASINKLAKMIKEKIK